MPQYAILRFKKMKGGSGALEAHHERTKEIYASNPDIDTAKSSRNFHIVKPETSYKRESDNRIDAAGCKTRKDSVRFVDALITASPEFFKGKKRAESNSCEGCGTIRTLELEQLVYDSMVEKLHEFNNLSGHRNTSSNPKLTAAKVELAQVDADIEKLVDSLLGANTALLSFANQKAEELEARKQTLTKQIADLTDASIPAAKMTAISDYLDDWDNTGFDDKRQVADCLISAVRATSESIEIEWKI